MTKRTNSKVFFQKLTKSMVSEHLAVVFGSLFAQTQKRLCRSKQTPNKKNNGILLAPIHFDLNELLCLYNKYKEILHLLNISYSLVRGVPFQGICLLS